MIATQMEVIFFFFYYQAQLVVQQQNLEEIKDLLSPTKMRRFVACIHIYSQPLMPKFLMPWIFSSLQSQKTSSQASTHSPLKAYL